MIERSQLWVGYLFAYFTGDSIEGESIRLAVSEGNDVLHWTELNRGRPVLTSTLGTTGVRDPCLVRGPVGFHLLATDLSIGSGVTWAQSQRRGSRGIEIWSSPDLVTWSEQRHVEIAPAWAADAWAPEAVFDEGLGDYFVFWSSASASEAGHPGQPSDHGHVRSYHRMLAATTRDFIEFTDVMEWQNPGRHVIDATVLVDGGVYHRFAKVDSEADSTGILHETSRNLRAPASSMAWRRVDNEIGASTDLGPVEGPIIVKTNPGDVNGPGYYLFLDEYRDRGYLPFFTERLDHPKWEIPNAYRLPVGARHGSVLPITRGEADALRKSYG